MPFKNFILLPYSSHSSVDPSWLSSNKTFFAVEPIFLSIEAESRLASGEFKELKELIKAGIQSGEIQPLPTHVFSSSEVEEALRFMAGAKHTGKVVIRMREELRTRPQEGPIPLCVPQNFFNAQQSYIIVGGLGGMGLELVYWMVQKGARKIILTSRVGLKHPYQTMSLNRLRKAAGVDGQIIVSVNDAITEESARSLMEEAMALGTVGGIFNLPLVLADSLLENQSIEKFESVCKTKLNSAHNLDKLSRSLCASLDYFVCFSSMVSGLGNAGQSNYAFANSAIERICEIRRSDGLHGLAIQWGVVGDVGFVAERYGNRIVVAGFEVQRIFSCMESLDRLLFSNNAVCSSFVLSGMKKFLHEEDFLKKIFHVLGVRDPNSLDGETKLGSLGPDSLMIMEVGQILETEFGMSKSAQEIRDLTINELKKLAQQHKNREADDSMTTLHEHSPESMLNPSENLFNDLNQGEGIPVFCFPGIIGHFKDIQPVLKNLARPTVGVHFTDEMLALDSIPTVGCFYAEKLREFAKDNTSFDLMGYSWGGLIALEVAAHLQKNCGSNSVSNLILVDAAPDPVKARAMELPFFNQNLDDRRTHTEILLSFVSSCFPLINPDDLRNTLVHLPTNEERYQKLAEIINRFTRFEVNLSNLIRSIDHYHKKMKLLYVYECQVKFDGNVTLIKASDGLVKYSSVETRHDLGISKVS